jgi:RNA polymerase sigma factor (sigma-70 family)
MTAASLSAVVRHVRRIAEPGPCGRSDGQLLEHFTLQQDEGAFAELVRRHGPMVLAACRRVLRHEQDAEDAFQATFLVLARKAGSVRRRESVGSWLYQVARRLALRARAGAVLRRERLTALDDGLAAPSPTPAGAALDASLDEELQRLPERYRSAVVLCYLEGRTQAEAARALATTADAVNSRLKRARDLLRQRLVRRGLALSGAAVAEALAAEAARAALPAVLVERTARAALSFATGQAPAWAALSTGAAALANGALHAMNTLTIKALAAVVVVAALLTGGALLVSPPALGDGPEAPPAAALARRAAARRGPKARAAPRQAEAPAQLHPVVDERRPQPDRHVRPQAGAPQRGAVRRHRHQRQGCGDQPEPAAPRQAGEPPGHHPLAEAPRRRPRSRHPPDAHRLRE